MQVLTLTKDQINALPAEQQAGVMQLVSIVSTQRTVSI
jgi:hypothetical protein